MIRPCVALGLNIALDVDGARRADDYAGLDDADVARALEQLALQRHGCARPPWHLRAITACTAVIDDGSGPRITLFDALNQAEAGTLEALFDAWPAAGGDGHTVCWRGDEIALIIVRAFVHAIPVAAGLRDWPRVALAECLHPADSADQATENEWARLTGCGASGGGQTASAATRACNRYRWWLRWQYVHQRIGADTWREREAALAQQRAANTAAA